jgi:hypothetical protein
VKMGGSLHGTAMDTKSGVTIALPKVYLMVGNIENVDSVIPAAVAPSVNDTQSDYKALMAALMVVEPHTVILQIGRRKPTKMDMSKAKPVIEEDFTELNYAVSVGTHCGSEHGSRALMERIWVVAMKKGNAGTDTAGAIEKGISGMNLEQLPLANFLSQEEDGPDITLSPSRETDTNFLERHRLRRAPLPLMPNEPRRQGLAGVIYPAPAHGPSCVAGRV